MIHGKVHAKANLAPAPPGYVQSLPSIWAKDSAGTAGAMSSRNNLISSSIPQKRDIQAYARVWLVWALHKSPESHAQEKQGGI